MSLFNRLTTWVSGQLLKSADLNGEFNNLVNGLNNLDGATTAWDNVKTGGLVSTGITTLKGSITNDSAAAGNIGEFITSGAVGPTSAPTSGNYGDLANISLTAGDWDVSMVQILYDNNAPITTPKIWSFGMSTTTGNSGTGLSVGDNAGSMIASIVGGSTGYITTSISSWRLSLASTTTVYLKMLVNYDSGTPQLYGRISARRMR